MRRMGITSMSKKTLLVVIPDRLSALVRKGEITNRYYNPGDLFDEVHILMTNDDRVNPEDVQKTVGRAQLYLHNLPVPSFKRTLGWQPFLLKDWVKAGVQVARRVQPALMRAHGNYANGYLAAHIRKRLGIPLVVSIHIPDVDMPAPWWPHWKRRLLYERRLVFEKETLSMADWVLPVYEELCVYAERLGAKRIQVCYNVVNPDYLRQNQSYALHTPPRIISVGRQFEGKNPDNLIRAVARLKTAELTLVGDGPFHDYLQQVAREFGVAERVVFHKAIPNDNLCRMLPEFDIFATHMEGLGISKTTLEALLTGLPVVLNRRIRGPSPELQGDWVRLVENSREGYYAALQELLTNHVAREALGRRAYRHAQERYAPPKTEGVFVDLYRSLLPKGGFQ